MHKSSMLIMERFATGLARASKRILDLGSQDLNGSYKTLFVGRDYIGADIVPGNNVDVVLKDQYDWKEFEDESFDAVISGQTFEHIEFFWQAMVEINRVLRKGHYCCIITPSIGGKHGRKDCYRFFDDGLRAAAKWAKMGVIECYTERNTAWCDTVLVARKSLKAPILRSKEISKPKTKRGKNEKS